MKPGDMIKGKKYQDVIRLIIGEHYESRNHNMPPFRVFKILHEDGNIEFWGAKNIELYWEVISENW